MSLQQRTVGPVPENTARVAHAAFAAGNPYVRMRDEFGSIFADEDFAGLFAARGRPAEAPWRLALVTVFQFAEGLSDRQAAEAVRARIDWKYALSLPLDDAGFDHTVLSEFRGRLVDGGAEHLLLDRLLERFRDRGLLKARGRQRTDSTHVLTAVRALSRLELVRETVRHALDVLAALAPSWLRSHASGDWVARYRGRSDAYRLPRGKDAQRALAEEIGADGAALLAAASAPDAPPGLRAVLAVDTLRVWVQNYLAAADGLRWRTVEDGIPKAAQFVSSPHDRDARLARKRTTAWVGYKAHLTETCDDDAPSVVTHVATTPASTDDGAVTPRVHRGLAAAGLLPRVHLVDTGFLDAELLVLSQQEYGVDLLGPTRREPRWRARAASGFGVDAFAVDWERRRATCP